MPVCDHVTAVASEKPLAQAEPPESVHRDNPLFRRLPAAFQQIVKQQWQSLRRELEEEELLLALESFSRYMITAPAVARPRANDLEELTRTLLERIGLWQLVEAGDEELRYHLALLQEFFATALGKLTVRQQQIIRLATSTGHSCIEIARVMNFTSIAAVEAFQHSAFRAIAVTLSVLFSLELNQPQVETRRRDALLQWQEVFAKRATA